MSLKNIEIVANVPGKGLARIDIQEERIASVQILGPLDAEKPYASPGLIDIQLNGYAGIDFDPAGLDLEVNGTRLYRQGTPVAFDEAAVSQSIRENHDTHVVLRFSDGNAKVRFWTTDLTAEYVRLNADYHT